MLTITDLFLRTLAVAETCNWDHIYIGLDWHDTLTKSTYDSSTALDFYDDCVDCLKMLSVSDKYKLILFTSSYPTKCKELETVLYDKGIHIDYINENPEVPNTDFGDFSDKFYFNILLDDKAGMTPEEDWPELKQWLLMDKQ